MNALMFIILPHSHIQNQKNNACASGFSNFKTATNFFSTIVDNVFSIAIPDLNSTLIFEVIYIKKVDTK